MQMMIPMVIMAIESDDDRAYMTVLYERHYPLMLKMAWKYTKELSNVEDIVSDSCTAIIERLDTVRSLSEKAQTAYIVTTVRNTAIDFYRRQQREKNRHLPYDEKKEYADPGSLEQKILLQEEINGVLQAIQTLPEREKDILRLKYHHGMATKEIALETGLAESTIRVLLGRARQHLKHLLYEGGAK